MNLNTFFQSCVYICLCLIALTLVINFVHGLDIFDMGGAGYVSPVNTSAEFGGFLQGGSITGMDGVWDIVLTVAGVAAVGIALLMHSAIPIGAYIFSGVFWVSYGNALGVLNGLHIPSDFLLIGTVLMLFFWAGALAGMFSGSG